jgi:hypothetical protein
MFLLRPLARAGLLCSAKRAWGRQHPAGDLLDVVEAVCDEAAASVRERLATVTLAGLTVR